MGEGIFFTSKVFDRFDTHSGRLHFLHGGAPLDLVLDRSDNAPGTAVLMRISNRSTRGFKDVFDDFAAPDADAFAKTIVPVRFAIYEGEALASRLQTKRLYRRFECFQNVLLDFEGVAEIGRAFADELFRVFSETHPATRRVPINMTDGMRLTRARARRKGDLT